MKITCTKKLLIIILALLCAVTVGLGGYWLAQSYLNGSVETVETDESRLQKVAAKTEYDYRLIDFYSHAAEISPEDLLVAAETDHETLIDDMVTFANAYSEGEIQLSEEAEKEDWFIAPDEASSFAGTNFGLLTIWSNYYASKNGGYNSDFYWDSTGFALGRYTRWTTNKGRMAAGDGFLYSFVWLDEGEYFDFGFDSTINYNSVTLGATYAPQFFDSYLNGYHFKNGSDSATPSHTLAQYKTEFGSTITPTTQYMRRLDSTGNGAGQKRVRISADAPSGVYYMRFYGPSNITAQSSGRFLASCPTSYTHTNSSCGVWNENYATDHMNNWSLYIDFTIIVCRRSATKLSMQYEPGVDASLTSKTVEYTGDPISLTLENDWSDGLAYYNVYERNESGAMVQTTTYNTSSATYSTVANAACRMTTRSARGSGTRSTLVFQATSVGEYEVRVTPYQRWSDGTNSTLTFRLFITQRSINKPSLLEGTGVDVDNNRKYVNDNGAAQSIEFHPLMEKYLNVNRGGLAQSDWTSDGLLVLSGTAQSDYTITVSLKNNSDMVWADGTYDPIVFHFIIGPMLIDIPELIQDGGVSGNRKQVTFSGSTQTMQFQPVTSTQVAVTATNGATYSFLERTLTVSAMNAGTYNISLKPQPGFGWIDTPIENATDPLEYEFIIDTRKITAPVLVRDGVTDNHVEVTYGGEYDAEGKTWVETLTFDNCRQFQVNYIAPGMNPEIWRDTQLVLNARNAQEYTITFECRPNYEWDEGVVPPVVTLIIHQRPIEKPHIVTDDGDRTQSTTFTESTKEMQFDFEEHHMILWVGDDAALNISANSALSERRNTDSGTITYVTTNSGNYQINIAPNSNYCWEDDGTNDYVEFHFVINPLELPQLPYYYYNDLQDRWDQTWGRDDAGRLTVTNITYDGHDHTVHVGDGSVSETTGFTTSWHYYQFINEGNNPLSAEEIAAMQISASVDTGMLEVTVRNAGVYFIAIDLNRANYAWEGTNGSSRVVYSIQVRPQRIDAPQISRRDCSAPNDTDFRVDEANNAVHAVYWSSPITLGISLPHDYADRVAREFDGNEVTYNGWTDAGILTFTAINVNRDGHEIKLILTDTNYTWAVNVGGNQLEYFTEITFRIRIIESPIAGLALSYHNKLTDRYDRINDAALIDGGTQDYQITFSESDEEFRFERMASAGMAIIQTGFEAQYAYEIVGRGWAEGYDETIASNIKSGYIGSGAESNGLDFSVYNAGRYTVTVWPTSNYCWNIGTSDRGAKTPIVFNLTVNRLGVALPQITNSTGYDEREEERISTADSSKSIDYSITQDRHLTINLGAHPMAYATRAWDGIGVREKDLDELSNTWTAYAKDKADYSWEIELSSINDYAWETDFATYSLHITALSINLPTAYIVPDGTDFGDIDTVSDKREFNIQNGYTNGTPYDGHNHVFYLFGNAIESGAVTVTYTFATTNGQSIDETYAQLIQNVGTEASSYQVISFDSANNNENNADVNAAIVENDKYTAYKLNACKVNSYSVTVAFKDGNYLWSQNSTEGYAGTSNPITFVYNITTKVLDVPVLDGYQTQPLTDNSHYAYFTYAYDTARDVNILNVNLGDRLDDGTYLYSNFAISSDAGYADTSNGSTTVELTAYDETTGFGTLNMRTGAEGVAANVPTVYCVAISLDAANERWNSGGSVADTNNKYFRIVINKLSVTIPSVSESAGRPSTMASDQDRYVIYTGERWDNAFIMHDVDSMYMRWEEQVDGMTVAYDPDTANGQITLSTDAPVNDYQIKVSLLDTDNLQWAGGSDDELLFGLIVQPIAVAKTKIFVETTEGQEGVAGDTKTVEYNYEEFELHVRNYWYDAQNRWMSYSVISAKQFAADGEYSPGWFPAPDPINANAEGYSTTYDIYNTGLLTFRAMYAGEYVLEFKLSNNAVWSDGSTDPVTITLLINKKEYATPYIYVDETDTEKTVYSNTKTYSYKIDENGRKVDRLIEIVNFNEDIMSMSGTTGDGLVDDGLTGLYYTLRATDAGTYTVEFKITDFENTRWRDVDRETIEFVLEIEKLSLTTVNASREYLLVNEILETSGATTTLSVEYDTKSHSVLIENLLNDFYMTYTPSRSSSTAGGNFYSVTEHAIADIGGTTVGELYGSTYNGPKANNFVLDATKTDFLMLTPEGGFIPDNYTVTVSLTDSRNMQWSDGTVEDKVFVLNIEKMEHDAPRIAVGESNAKQYNGGDVEFVLSNVYNGKMTADGEVTTYAYETYKVTSFYNGTTRVNYTDDDDTSFYEKSWYDGTLTLKMHEVGTYTIVVRINPEVAAYTSWRGTNDTSRTFTLTVLKRTLTAEFIFSSSEENVNAALELGSSQWCLSSPVSVTLRIHNIVWDEVADSLDRNFSARIYYLLNSSAQLHNLEDISASTWMVAQNDGTYTLNYMYMLPYGSDNISIGAYSVNAEQTNAADGNYVLNNSRRNYTIIADPAPFNDSLLIWRYTISTDTTGSIYAADPGLGDNASNAFTVPFRNQDNGRYTFSLWMTAEGLAGPEGDNRFTNINDALNAWWVKIDSITGLTQRNAGQYTASVTLSALDSSLYSFTTRTINFYYNISRAKYNLNDLHWNYSGTPFTFDGSSKSVGVVGNPYNRLSVGYDTSGSFSARSQTYAGTYTACVRFTNNDTNYETPIRGNASTYEGTFDWTLTWAIDRQTIDVWWREGNTSSDGTTVSKSPILAVHNNKVNYTYRRQNPSTGAWENVTSLNRRPGETVQFEVTANLASSTTQSRNYARNYILNFINGDTNPMRITLGGNDEVIYNHIEINGTTDHTFEYTGSRFTASVIIDLDTSGGAITNSNLRINYYVRGSSTPLSAAPYQIGDYVVRVRAVWNNSSVVYYLSEDEYEFSIVKANFDPDAFSWHYTHTDSRGVTVSATYDPAQNLWLNSAGEPVTFTYDGAAHRIYLSSTYGTGTIRMTMQNASYIEAGSYTSTASFTYNTNLWNAPRVTPTFRWSIERAVLDLSDVHWDYNDDYVFALVDGAPVPYNVEVAGLPDYLLDKVEYSTMANGIAVENSQSLVGEYITTIIIDPNNEIDTRNYILGTFPEAVPQSFGWEITPKILDVPVSDGSWTQFDGKTHNLLYVFDTPIDWEEYYSITVTYASENGTPIRYDGSLEYGFEFMAYDAGTYNLAFAIRDGINDEEHTNVVWFVPTHSTGSNILIADDQSSSLTIGRQVLLVTGWTDNYESSTILTQPSISTSRFISYEFHEGTSPTGALLPLDTILEAAPGTPFTLVPFVKDDFKGNIELTFDNADNEYHVFYAADLQNRNGVQIAGKPFIYGYSSNGREEYFTSDVIESGNITVMYTGYPITFLVNNWDYYSAYLNFWNGDEFTQTDAGDYSATYIFKLDDEDVYYWNQREDGTYDRSSVTFTYSINYMMIDLPDSVPENITYLGSEIDILELAFGTSAIYDQWLVDYGEYIEISGNTARDIGKYELYLRIKEDYASSIRWEDGYAGTKSYIWTIDPILLTKPTFDENVTLVYDEEEHSVYEVLVGYSEDSLSPELLKLMQNARLSVAGSRSINAGEFTATFSLPDSNYAWTDGDSRDDVVITWKIEKQVIDLGQVHWIQTTETESWDFDENKPFVYTIANGRPVAFSVELGGLAEVLLPFLTYTTNDMATNSMSEVGDYTTSFVLSYDGRLDTDNYEIAAIPDTFNRTLNWKIVERGFDAPENSGDWTSFDGKAHDLMVLLGYEEGWDNYFDVIVRYSEDGETYKELDPFDDATEETEDSIYKGYRNGFYQLTVSIKDSDLTNGLVYWNDETAPLTVTIAVSKMTVTITGWSGDEDSATAVISETLSESEQAMLEYALYESDTKTPVTAQDISGGITYTKELRAKSEYAFGIEFVGTTTFSFGTGNYENQNVIWMPLPVLKESVKTFTGDEIAFEIVGWDNDDAATRLYYLSDNIRSQYNWQYNLSLSDNDIRYAYIYGGDQNLKRTEAGEYEIIVRLNGQLRLAWYDNAVYTVDRNGRLILRDGGEQVENATEDRSSKVLKFKIEPAKVVAPDLDEIFKDVELVLEYKEENGQKVPQNITESELYKDIFEYFTTTYGSLIEFVDAVQTDAGNYKLKIQLADPESSYWALGEFDEEELSLDGYTITYVLDNGIYKAVYEKDGVEYGGDYVLDLNYTSAYELVYVDLGADESAFLDTNGIPLPATVHDDAGAIVYDSEGNPINVQYVVNGDGTAVRYDFDADNGSYVVAANGRYIAKYMLDKEGERLRVIDTDNSTVKGRTEKTSTDPIELDWKIVMSTIDAPTLKTDVTISYTSGEIDLTDYLDGFDPDKMKIEGGKATEAGNYTATITLTDSNRVWYTEDGSTPESITINWTIGKATIDLSSVTWNYTNDTVYTYTVENGKPKAYKVELVFPEALKDYKNLIIYTTNSVSGANAGRNAGKYETTFRLNYDAKNIASVVIPDEISSLTWYINKRTFEIPTVKETKIVFNDRVYNVLDLINMPDGWENYLTLEVGLVSGSYTVPYAGYDGDKNGIIEGNEKYLIYGVGTYRFSIGIISGTNTNILNPNVVWVRPDNTEVTPPTVEGGADDSEMLAPTSVAMLTFMILPEETVDDEITDELPEIIESDDMLLAPDSGTYDETEGGNEGENPGENEGGNEGENPGENEGGNEGENPGENEDGDEDIDDDQIVDPEPDDRDEYISWTLLQQVITLGIDRLELLVTGWTGENLQARINIDYDGSGYPADIVEIIKNINFLDDYLVTDIDGNPVDEASITNNPGHTYFITPQIKSDYANYIVLRFADERDSVYSFSTEFPDGTQLTDIPNVTVFTYTENFTGEEIEFTLDFLNEYSNVLKLVDGSLTHTDAGTYYVTIAFIDDAPFQWADGTRNAVTIRLEILAQVIDVIESLPETTYTGTAIDVNELLNNYFGGDFVKVVTGYDTTVTDVGEHEVTVQLNPAYGGNVAWSSGAEGNIIIKVPVVKAEVMGSWTAMGTLEFESDSFKGNFDELATYQYVVTRTGEIVQDIDDLEVGTEYTVTVTLDDSNINFTGFDNPHTFTLEVKPTKLSRPVISDNKKPYTGQQWTFVIDNWDEIKDYVDVIGDDLTQSAVGVYTVTISIKQEYTLWDTLSSQPVTLTFEIEQAVIDGNWNSRGRLVIASNSYSGTYENIVSYSYTDSMGRPVSIADLQNGMTYTVTANLLDLVNFRFADTLENPHTFVYDSANIISLQAPVLAFDEAYYRGSPITFTITNLSTLSPYVDISYGSLRQSDAGEYTVILTVKGEQNAEWEGGLTSYEIHFRINRAIITGSWNSDGTARLNCSTYPGDLESVVVYEYSDVATLATVSRNELQDGEDYIVTIRLIDTDNFDIQFTDSFTQSYQFTYSERSGGGTFTLSWWQIFLIILAIIIFILIILIIIVVIRRKRAGAYDIVYVDDDPEYDGSGDASYGDGADAYGDGDYPDSGDAYGDYSDASYGDGADAYGDGDYSDSGSSYDDYGGTDTDNF